jgi:hypothetical protein
MVNSQFVSDAELNDWINDSLAELYGIVVESYGDDYYEARASFQTVAGQSLYPLDTIVGAPADFFKLVAVEIAEGSNWWPARRFQDEERYRLQTCSWDSRGASVRHRLVGSNLELVPTPPGVYSMRIRYVPRAPQLAADGTEFDSINGWHEFVVCDVAAKMLEKEESDSGPLRARKAEFIDRLKSATKNRDQGGPHQMIDTTRLVSDIEDGGWW